MADQFVLNEDGTVKLGWRDFSVTLREPEVGEWLSFEQEFGRANAWARGEDQEVPEGEESVKPTIAEAAENGPFLALYGRMIRELGIGLTGEVPALPIWLVVAAPYARISAWWSTSPLSRREAAAMTRALSQ